MKMSEAARIKIWAFGLALLALAAAFLTIQVNPLMIALAYLALLAGIMAIGLLSGLWGGLVASAVGVFAMAMFNQFAGLYLRESTVFNIATELAVYLLVGPAAGGLAQAVARMQRQAHRWLELAEERATHDEALGALKPAWAIIRLEEEILRAAHFARPLTVAVLQMEPLAGTAVSRSGRIAALQSLIRIARAHTESPTVVAHAGSDQVLMILPERATEEARRVIQRVQTQAASELYYPDGRNGALGRPLSEWGRLRTGLACANGQGAGDALLAQALKDLETND